jgi:hypothetical protein
MITLRDLENIEDIGMDFYERRRKKTIDDYFILKNNGEICKDDGIYKDFSEVGLFPQLSCKYIEDARLSIEEFYKNNLDYIEYGSTSMFTIHSLYRDTNGKIYNVFTSPKKQKYIFDSSVFVMKLDPNDTTPLEDENGYIYFDILYIFPVNALFLRNTFYTNLNNQQVDMYYSGAWEKIEDDSIKIYEKEQNELYEQIHE